VPVASTTDTPPLHELIGLVAARLHSATAPLEVKLKNV
jgi:hypothetical protein